MGSPDAAPAGPIVVLFGGGASAHLGFPVGDALTDRIIKAVQEEGPARAFWEQCLKEQELDFEGLLQECDDVSVSRWAESVTRLPNWTKRRRADCTAVRGAQALRLLIRREIVEAFRTPDHEALTTSPWLDLLPAVTAVSSGVPVRLFTTNYDTGLTALEPALRERKIELLSGFRREAGVAEWTREHLEEAIEGRGGRTSGVTAVHLQLHGAVSWHRNTAKKVVELYDEDGIPRSGQEGKELIWPAIRKLPFADPFWCHHGHLVWSLREASAVLFLGYGFRDEAIMALIKLALERRPEPPRMAILDTSKAAVGRATNPGSGCIRDLSPGVHIERKFTKEAIPLVLAAMGLGSHVDAAVVPAGHAESAEARSPVNATPASVSAGGPAPSLAGTVLLAPPPSAVSDHLTGHADALEMQVKEYIRKGDFPPADLREWGHQGGQWSVTRSQAVSPGSASLQVLVSPQDYTTFGVSATLQDLTRGSNWYGIAVFWGGPQPFLVFQVQSPTVKVKWNAVHKPDRVPPPGRALRMGEPLFMCALYDGEVLRFAAVQPALGLLSYYETPDVPGRTGRIALMVREGQYQTDFSNVYVGQVP